MFCPSCGRQIPNDSLSCPNCFSPVDPKHPIHSRSMRPRKRPSLLKAMLAGFFMGALGSIAGFFPITYLHNFLNPYAMHLERGSLLRTLMLGYPLYIGAVFYLPAVGALVGVLTGILAYLRKSRRAWLWGFLAGFLLNLFVSFWAM